MRSKPDLSALRAPQSPEEFIAGSAVRARTTKKQQKLVHLTRKLVMAIKQRALDESAASGERITDSDLIEKAVWAYLNSSIG
jgi:hypothetical protein